MVNREKVIEGLHTCFTKADCSGCPYEEECRYVMLGKKKGDEWHCPILDDVMELLNDQVARVMTIDEVLNWANPDLEDAEPVYVEWSNGAKGWYIHEKAGIYITARMGLCRCWTKKPTAEQIKSERWGV